MIMYRLVFVFLISGSVLALAAASSDDTSSRPGECVLPEPPEHGSYVVSEMPNAKPGMTFELVRLNYTCEQGYGITGKSDFICNKGFWSDTPNPKCVRLCELKKHASVEYKCLLSGSSEGFRVCDDYEPKGTNVLPECRKPNYYSEETLPKMVCNEHGEWNYIAKCQPECGMVTPIDTALVLDGRRTKRGELPWQAGIYTKLTIPYMQICGGTLISDTVVLSAAHCFWGNGAQLPKEEYAVALGKLYRPWMLKQDDDVQQSDIKDIHIPPHFVGKTNYYTNDIAVVVLEKNIVYKPHVRPVCLSFDNQFEMMQLQEGTLGKVGGWGIKDAEGNPSPVLKVVELPLVSISNCISQSPLEFRPYITADKICANGTGLCKGDGGGGLSFPYTDKGTQRYYLRGVVSTAHTTNDACNAYTLTTFTSIMPHEHFIKQFY